MIAWAFVLFILFILSTYLFGRMKQFLALNTLVAGIVLIVNDWNSNLIPDDTTKLIFLLLFIFYSILVYRNIQTDEV